MRVQTQIRLSVYLKSCFKLPSFFVYAISSFSDNSVQLSGRLLLLISIAITAVALHAFFFKLSQMLSKIHNLVNCKYFA